MLFHLLLARNFTYGFSNEQEGTNLQLIYCHLIYRHLNKLLKY